MSKFHTVVVSMLATMLAIAAVFIFGPPIETRFFPVYSKFEIISVEPYGEGRSRAVFRFAKLRECAPQGFAWYSGDLGAAYRQLDVLVEREPGTGGAPRPIGEHISRPYVINVPPDTLRNAVFAEIYSRCHFLWSTRTDIYP